MKRQRKAYRTAYDQLPPTSQPLTGRMTAFAIRYVVMTHVLSSTPAARLPAMWRSATLAIDVSSTSMKVAMDTTTAISQATALAGRRSALSFVRLILVSIDHQTLIGHSSNLHLRHHRHPRSDINVGCFSKTIFTGTR